MTMPYESGGEELLEYEAEQDETPGPVMPIDPLPVHVCSPVVTVATVPQHVTASTRVLTAAQPYAQILAQDPLRVRVMLTALDADVVLCHTASQAQDPANADATLAAPNGAVLSSCGPAPYPVSTTQPLWICGNTFPCRVSVITERRTT